MEQIRVQNILEWLPVGEADIVQYFGKIRNGKTYIATSDILDLLNQGHVVYANWRLKWNGRDERKELIPRIFGFLGLKKTFFVYPKENLKFLPIDEKFFDTFAKITNAYVFLDEGHLVFNSYEMTNMKIDKQSAILFTGHFDRSIRIISQRPNNVHVQMRANVNVFVQCEKVFSFFGLVLFRKTFYEDMIGETVDLDKPAASKLYRGQKKIYSAYSTKYLRGSTPESQQNLAEMWYWKWWEQIASLFKRKPAHKLPMGSPVKGAPNGRTRPLQATPVAVAPQQRGVLSGGAVAGAKGAASASPD